MFQTYIQFRPRSIFIHPFYYIQININEICNKKINCDFFVFKKGKPSKPKGPLKVSDVNAEGCKLDWEPPEDDGGEPIQQYVVEKMDTETGRWVPVLTTKEPGAEITGLVPGKDYKFRVKAVNPEGESEPLETDKATTAKNPFGMYSYLLDCNRY